MQYAHIQRSIYLHTQHLSILGFLMGLICTGITKNSKDFSINGLVEGNFCCQETFIHWNVPWFPVDIPIHWFSTHLDQVSQPSALPIAFPWALCCQRIALHGWVPACWSWMQWQQVRISGWFGSGLITSLNDWECKGGIINYGEMELRIYFLNFNWMDLQSKNVES